MSAPPYRPSPNYELLPPSFHCLKRRQDCTPAPPPDTLPPFSLVHPPSPLSSKQLRRGEGEGGGGGGYSHTVHCTLRGARAPGVRREARRSNGEEWHWGRRHLDPVYHSVQTRGVPRGSCPHKAVEGTQPRSTRGGRREEWRWGGAPAVRVHPSAPWGGTRSARR